MRREGIQGPANVARESQNVSKGAQGATMAQAAAGVRGVAKAVTLTDRRANT